MATHGQGSTHVALIHGGSGDNGLFDDLTAAFVVAGKKVTTVDLRGHGLSDRANSYTLQEFGADLVETLPSDVDVVMGHSLGALAL